MFLLNLVTPDKKIVTNEELEEIVLPAERGELNILKGHAPLMTTLQPGVLKYRLKSGESKTVAISWGYCQVSSVGVNVLAEEVISREEIFETDVRQKLKEQETRLGTQNLNDDQWQTTQYEVARLKAELQLLNQ